MNIYQYQFRTELHVKHLIIELYGYAVCFIYALASNKRISQMILSVMSNPVSLLESMR
jgi:hypothetical protein